MQNIQCKIYNLFCLNIYHMPDFKSKVLYVAGFERSGSTVIDRVLGQVGFIIAWVEFRDVWEYGLIENIFTDN